MRGVVRARLGKGATFHALLTSAFEIQTQVSEKREVLTDSGRVGWMVTDRVRLNRWAVAGALHILTLNYSAQFCLTSAMRCWFDVWLIGFVTDWLLML